MNVLLQHADDPCILPDIDECSLGLDSCSPLQVCENTLGSFICVCIDGYNMILDDTCTGEQLYFDIETKHERPSKILSVHACMEVNVENVN